MSQTVERPAGPPAGRPAPVPPSIEQQVLLEDEHSRIEWHHAPGDEARPVVIIFDPLMYLWPKPAFGLDFLLRQGVQVVAVRRKTEHFYQPLTRAAFMAAVAPVLALHERVLAYGSSLGAYAALYYAHDLDAQVIALSPRVSVHPVYGSKAWQARAAFQHEQFEQMAAPRCRAVIVYDPREAIDRRFIDQGVRPHFSDARYLRLPFTGHPTTQFLGDLGYLAPWIRTVVAGQPEPPLDRRAGRRKSTTYYQVLADLCARRGRLAVAEALVERSLALRDNHMLAHRTRGLVKTLRRDWDEAIASLERALAFDPADPLTISMLKKARQGREEALRPCPPPPAAPVPAPKPASPWRRLLRRALRRRT